ncbi:MFS transporter [Paraburkholderia tropica]|uniref:MFS transporter, DHA2 family, multidrug resistance protein n=2 Tax=Paraburkholderia tropica TaxID=92647 RepID=A0AAQ1GKR7_9BURK|nr:MFS transporter [Paraburkholderia tropica]SEK08208.1 MFS transporter, DHA2 family, multidrug resistance protein [Paraburkholderia tropica]
MQTHIEQPQRPAEGQGLPERQRWLVMGCILLGILLSNLDSAIANIALPTLVRELGTSDAAVVWVVNGYQLAVAVCLLPAAALGEIVGHKRIYAIGLVLFLIGSVCCASAPSLSFLVAARVLQGVGGACLAALGPALVRSIYPRSLIARGFASIALVVAMSGALGPTVAALILSVAAWPWLFLVNVPACVVAIPLFLAVAPRGQGVARPFDLSGALLNAIALGLLVLGVDILGHDTGRAIAMLAVGAVFLMGLVWHQSRRAAPLLPLDLLRIPVIALSGATSVCSYAAQIIAYISVPFLLQTLLHRSAVETGLLVTPWPLLVAVAAPIAGRLSARYPAAVLGSVGLAVLACGLVSLAMLPASPGDLDIAIRMAVCGAGFGFFQTPNNTTMMTSGPVARSGAAGGLVAVARTVGWCLGSSLVTMLFQLNVADRTTKCLAVAAAFAAAGAVVSLARGLTTSGASVPTRS